MIEETSLKINCPSCNNLFIFKAYKTINVTKNSNIKEDVLNLNIFKFNCKCGLSSKIFYPVLYQDDLNSFIIQFLKNNNMELINKLDNIKNNYSNYKIRIVNDPYLLIEKILIFDSNYDDRILEIMKEFMIASTNNYEIDKLLFAIDKDKLNSFLVLNKDGNSIGTLPFNTDLYKMVYDKFCDKLNIDYKIDQEWARKFLNEVKL